MITDRALLAELGDLLLRVDPVPDRVYRDARAAFPQRLLEAG